MKKILGIWLFCIVIFSCGCKERVFPNTDCYVYAVWDNPYLGSRVCQYGDTYYYYSDGMIYKYTDGESTQLINNIKNQVMDMSCNEKGVYYKIYSDSNLYFGDAQTGEVQEINLGKDCVNSYLFEEDVFALKEEESKYKLYILGDKEEKFVCELPEKEDEEATIEHEYEGYTFLFKYADGIWNLQNIRKDNQKQYAVSEVWINEKELSVHNEEFIYDGTAYDKTHIIESESGGCATALSQSNIYDGKIYFLYHYGLRAAGSKVNPCATDKRYNDSIYSLDPETGEVELVYKTDDTTIQIADFSMEHDVLYLLKNDGLYRCNMNGEEEEFILKNTYEAMSFENCNGKLFVFEGGVLDDFKLIAVVE